MLSERSAMLLRGLVEGRTQRELAEAEGVSASAVSQRVRRDGLGIVLRSDELLEEVR
jgi:DNA-binding Lrp family transcriptional regulator